MRERDRVDMLLDQGYSREHALEAAKHYNAGGPVARQKPEPLPEPTRDEVRAWFREQGRAIRGFVSNAAIGEYKAAREKAQRRGASR